MSSCADIGEVILSLILNEMLLFCSKKQNQPFLMRLAKKFPFGGNVIPNLKAALWYLHVCETAAVRSRLWLAVFQSSVKAYMTCSSTEHMANLYTQLCDFDHLV